MKDINTALSWAAAYCEEFSKSGKFDPLALLEGTSDRKQQIFCLCVDFLHEIESAKNKFSDDLKKLTHTA